MGVWSLVAGALTNVAIVAVCASALVRAEAGMRTGLISILAAAAAAVPALLAIESVGRWTVVAAVAVNTLLVSIGVRHATRGSSLRDLRRAAAFGTSSMRFLLLNIVNAVIGALPALIIGRLFGVAAVGLYDRAYALIVSPVDRAAAAVSGVLFSYHATLHRVGRGETEVFLRSLRLALFIGLLCAIVVARNDALIIQLTLGAGWSEAVPFVVPMAVFVVLVLTLQVAVPVLNGRGRPEIEIAIQLGAIALFLLLVSFVAHDSPMALVWALVAAYTFRVLCLLFSVGWLIELRTGPILRAALPGAAAAILVLAAERAFALAVPGLDSGLGRLAALGGMSAAVVTVAWSRGLFSDLRLPFGRTGRPGR
jgi:O-antigen/teichoic acid export membrane protein